MTDPVLALLIALVFLPLLIGARWFKTLDADLRPWRTPILVGAVCGGLLHLFGPNAIAVGVALTFAGLYVRLTGEESEPSEGMLLGAAAGDVAALVVIVFRSGGCRELAACLIAGAVAGFGCTLAALYVGQTVRQFVIDVVTAIVAIGAATLPPLASRFVSEHAVAVAAAAIIPLLVLITMLQQYRDIRAELSHEASLGLVDPADVRNTAHPLLRLGSGGWSDRRAHREFVRLAQRIALRKRQQRHRSEETARLYQLEIIKLRMQMEEMSKINRLMKSEVGSRQ